MTHNTLFPFPQQGDSTPPPSTNPLHPIKSLLELQQKEHFQKQTEVLMLLLPHGNAGNVMIFIKEIGFLSKYAARYRPRARHAENGDSQRHFITHSLKLDSQSRKL